MRRTIIPVFLALLFAAAGAYAADGPTLFYYKTGGATLLTAIAGDNVQPLSLLFTDNSPLSEELARRLGPALFPGEIDGRSDSLKAFQSALHEQFGTAARPLGYFGVDTVRQIAAAADQLKSINSVGPVRLVYLNLALQDRQGTPLLREFIRLTAIRRAGAQWSDQVVDQCRLTLHTSLETFVANAVPTALVGILQGPFAEANCASGDAAAVAPAAEAVPPAAEAAPPPRALKPANVAPPEPATEETGVSALSVFLWIAVLALVALGIATYVVYRRNERARQAQLSNVDLSAIARSLPANEEPPVIELAGEEPLAFAAPAETPADAEMLLIEASPIEAPDLAATLAAAANEAADLSDLERLKNAIVETEKLRGHMAQLAEAAIKTNQRMESLVKSLIAQGLEPLEARLRTVEGALARGGAIAGPAGMDRAILKRFNELELLLSESLGHVTQLLESQDRRLSRVEKGDGGTA